LSLTLREERRLGVENRVLRRIFGPKMNEGTGEWRKLHNEELNCLYFSQNIFRVIKSRKIGWAGHLTRMGENRGTYRVLVGKQEGKRPLGRSMRRLEDSIKIDLQVRDGKMDWIDLAQDRDRWRDLGEAVLILWVP